LREKKILPSRLLMAGLAVVLVVVSPIGTLGAKEKTPPVDPNDVTSRLFQLLDESRNGKLTDFFVLADIYKDKDSKDPNQEFQRVLLVEYDKSRNFGKLNLHLRSVGKLDPEQLKSYSLKQIYDFGVDDLEKFVKSEPGQFGRTGDLYLRSANDLPIATAPITEDTRKAYELYLSQYVIPALQKK
jgi:hypothetical protein